MILITSGSFVVLFSYQVIEANYEFNCPVDAKLKFKNTTLNSTTHKILMEYFPWVSFSNNTKNLTDIYLSDKIDRWKSMWGHRSSCNYIRYTPLVEAIYAFICMTLFIMCGHGGRQDNA